MSPSPFPPDEKAASSMIALSVPPVPSPPLPAVVSPTTTQSSLGDKDEISYIPTVIPQHQHRGPQNDCTKPIAPSSKEAAPFKLGMRTAADDLSIGALHCQHAEHYPFYRTYEDTAESIHGNLPASSMVWRPLGYLVFLNPFLCVFNAIYALLLVAATALCAVLPSTVRASLRLSFRQRLYRQLELQLTFLQLRLSAFPPSAQSNYYFWRLVAGHTISPVLSVPVSLLAVGVGLLWVYSDFVLGDKNSTEGIEYRAFLYVRDAWGRFVLGVVQLALHDDELV